jgi:epothilone polyketide synthase E
VALPLDEARATVAPVGDRLSVGASNGPTSTVLSGDPAALEHGLEGLRARNVFCRLVKIDVASHSPQMEELREDLVRALAGLAPRAPVVPFYSTVTAERVPGAALTPEYWARNLREPVLFHPTVQKLLDSGCGPFLELSPHPILLAPIEETLHAAGRKGPALPSLYREQGEREVLLSSLGALYASGREIEWRRLYPAGGRAVPLPRYPWQRKRHWVEIRADAGARAWPGAAPVRPSAHSDRAGARRYGLEWRPRGAAASTAEHRNWLVLADRGGVGAALAALLEERGERVSLVEADEPAAGDLESLARAAATTRDGVPAGIVNLWSLDAGAGEDGESIARALALGCRSTLRLFRALAPIETKPPQVWLVTRGAQGVRPGERVALGSAP